MFEDLILLVKTNLYAQLAVGATLAVSAYFGYRAYFYKYTYDKVFESKGIVTDMDYTPRRSTYHSTGKGGGYTTTTPEKHEVYFKTDEKETHIDSERLYQMVRLDDEIIVKYQKRYIHHKNSPHDKKFHGYRLISITSPKGRELEFKKQQPKHTQHTFGYSK